jgi:hypothetical protein
MIKRWISPSLFALAALSFALPFATVSCDSARTTFSGIQLVTHTVPHGGAVDEPPDCSGELSSCVEGKASTAAGLALTAVLLGLALGCLGSLRGPGWCAIAGLGGLLYLVGVEPFAVERLHAGFVLAAVALLAAGLLHAARAIGRAWRRRVVGSAGEQRAGAPG